MAIGLIKKYVVPMLDETYKAEAKTAILDTGDSLVKAGSNANEIVIPKITYSGLGAYDRTSTSASYPTGGSTSVAWETVTFNYDRSQKLGVQVTDNEETDGLAFGMMAGEFERNSVIPEQDAFRFATYASKAGTTVALALTTYALALAALRACITTMDEAEVPQSDRHLFITSAILGLFEDAQTIDSKRVLDKFATINMVPQARFYNLITLYDGSTTGQTDGGYIKNASTGKDINFIAIHKPAVLQYNKRDISDVIPAALNMGSDSDVRKYHKYGLADVYDNKVKGIYSHISTT